MPLWAAEDMDEELQDVDVNIGLGSYGQGEMYDEGTSYKNLNADVHATHITCSIAGKVSQPNPCDGATKAARKRRGICSDTRPGKTRTYDLISVYIYTDMRLVYRALSSSCAEEQFGRDYRCIRIWLEPTDRKVLREDGMAGC